MNIKKIEKEAKNKLGTRLKKQKDTLINRKLNREMDISETWFCKDGIKGASRLAQTKGLARGGTGLVRQPPTEQLPCNYGSNELHPMASNDSLLSFLLGNWIRCHPFALQQPPKEQWCRSYESQQWHSMVGNSIKFNYDSVSIQQQKKNRYGSFISQKTEPFSGIMATTKKSLGAALGKAWALASMRESLPRT